jgi:hypothetical protein
MRSVKIVRLQKYGIFGLILESGETEPDTGSDGILKRSSGLNLGPDGIRSAREIHGGSYGGENFGCWLNGEMIILFSLQNTLKETHHRCER